MSRPFSLSVIAILAILYGAASMIPKILVLMPSEHGAFAREFLSTMSSTGMVPLPSWFHIAHGLIGSAVWLVAGVFLWRGKRWASWLMSFWGLTVMLLTLSVYGYAGPFLWKGVTYLLLLYFLLKQSSRDYFATAANTRDA